VPCGCVRPGGHCAAMSRHRLRDGWTPPGLGASALTTDPSTPTQAPGHGQPRRGLPLPLQLGTRPRLAAASTSGARLCASKALSVGRRNGTADPWRQAIEVPWGLYALRTGVEPLSQCHRGTLVASNSSRSLLPSGPWRPWHWPLAPAYFDSASWECRSGSKVGLATAQEGGRSRASCRFNHSGFFSGWSTPTTSADPANRGG